jgi:carbon storage regulator
MTLPVGGDGSPPAAIGGIVLILSRKQAESFVIPSLDIEVVVVDIQGDKVKLGIVADPDVDIFRREVWRAIQRDERRKGEQPSWD